MRTPEIPEDANHTHRRYCPPEARTWGQFVGRKGDVLRECYACGTFRVVEPAPAVETTSRPAPEASLRAAARFVCREHHTQAVTWRGTGCRSCADEARRAAKKKPLPPPDEWDYDALFARLTPTGSTSAATR